MKRKIVNHHPTDPALIGKAIGIPPGEWAGRCYEIADRIRGTFDMDCRLVYGHWLGPVADGTLFSSRKHLTFQSHGWLELPDGPIYDPTRWVFEAKMPYVYVGVNDYYDEGGDQFRQAQESWRPIPKADPAAQKLPLALSGRAAAFVFNLFHVASGDLTFDQVVYPANMSRASLGMHAKAIYRAIVDAGQAVMIPLDNRDKILGRTRKGGQHEGACRK